MTSRRRTLSRMSRQESSWSLKSTLITVVRSCVGRAVLTSAEYSDTVYFKQEGTTRLIDKLILDDVDAPETEFLPLDVEDVPLL